MGLTRWKLEKLKKQKGLSRRKATKWLAADKKRAARWVAANRPADAPKPGRRVTLQPPAGWLASEGNTRAEWSNLGKDERKRIVRAGDRVPTSTVTTAAINIALLAEWISFGAEPSPLTATRVLEQARAGSGEATWSYYQKCALGRQLTTPSASLASMSRPSRGVAMHNTGALDCDIKAAMHAIAAHVGYAAGVPLASLTALLSYTGCNRDWYLEQAQTLAKCTAEQAKLLFIVLLFGGTVWSWRYTQSLPYVPHELIELCEPIQRALQACREAAEAAASPAQRAAAKRSGGKGALWHIILAEHENRAITAVASHLQTHFGCNIGCFIFDGLVFTPPEPWGRFQRNWAEVSLFQALRREFPSSEWPAPLDVKIKEFALPPVYAELLAVRESLAAERAAHERERTAHARTRATLARRDHELSELQCKFAEICLSSM